ncbi:MAG: hypothetical protein GXO47_08840 [Chlorobi bacterium]|nr:hypothetical protein [Chlorobiota bacterium]
MYVYNAKLKRVVDGDTVDLIIDMGFKITTEQRIRLKGIDTPEIWRRKKDSEEYKTGLVAKEYVIKRLEENGNEMVVRTERHPGVYGRYIADIILADSDMTLNDELLHRGLADVWG